MINIRKTKEEEYELSQKANASKTQEKENETAKELFQSGRISEEEYNRLVLG